MLRMSWVRVSLVAALAACVLAPAIAEGNVFEWNLGSLAAGKVYPTTITAQNRCSKKQTFEITLENLPWMHLVDPAKFSVPAGGQQTVKVELDTRGLQAGSFGGTVVIRCLGCKPPLCNQDRDTLKVSLVIPAVATAPPEPAPEEVLSGLEEGGAPAYAPQTEAGRVAMGPCEVLRQHWRDAVQRAKDGKPDCDEKRRKALQAKDEARKAQAEADEAKRVQEARRAARESANAELRQAEEDHAAFLRQILSKVGGIRLGEPFEANPERVWAEGYRYHGMTVPAGGLAYRDETGLQNLIDTLDKWADPLRRGEEKVQAKRDALQDAEAALKRAEQEALDAAKKADDKQSAADKAMREYLACIGDTKEAVARANGLLEKVNECLEIARVRDTEEIAAKKAEAETLAKLDLQRKENERRLQEEQKRAEEEALQAKQPPPRPLPPPPQTQEKPPEPPPPPNLPKPVPLLDQPQELRGGLRQVRLALYTEVKARAMVHYADQDCRYKCEKLLQSLLGEDFGNLVRDLGLDVMSAALSAFPAETTAEKAVVHSAKALLGFGKGKGALEVLSERAASLIGASLLPKVYGDWVGKQVNTFATGPAVKSILEAVQSGELEVWEVDKVVEGHLGGGEMFSCPVHMRILYSKATGYVVAAATCTCPRCPSKTMIFRYRADRDGQPMGAIEALE